MLSSSFTDQSIQVEGGTLDEMLIDNEILPDTVDYIDLTINEQTRFHSHLDVIQLS